MSNEQLLESYKGWDEAIENWHQKAITQNAIRLSGIFPKHSFFVSHFFLQKINSVLEEGGYYEDFEAPPSIDDDHPVSDFVTELIENRSDISDLISEHVPKAELKQLTRLANELKGKGLTNSKIVSSSLHNLL